MTKLEAISKIVCAGNLDAQSKITEIERVFGSEEILAESIVRRCCAPTRKTSASIRKAGKRSRPISVGP